MILRDLRVFATQCNSVRKFNWWLLGTTCESGLVWNCVAQGSRWSESNLPARKTTQVFHCLATRNPSQRELSFVIIATY